MFQMILLTEPSHLFPESFGIDVGEPAPVGQHE
jgi:hypothetical protein